MKSLFSISLFAALLGLGLGAGLAYVEVPPVANQRSALPEQSNPGEQPERTPEVSSLPKAELSETVFKFGNIERGTSMSHVFKIRNVGQMPLHVEVESTTCKCTVGDLSKNDIGPNEESEVLLEWVAKTGPGPFRHGAVLSTNDPTQSSINLTVEGQVVESTAMSPSELIFGTVRKGESPSATLYLMSFLDQEVKILDYELSDTELAKLMEISITSADLDELPSPDAKSGVKITATYRTGKTIGPFRSWLTLNTNLKNAEKLTVLIAGNVVGDISIFGPGWNAPVGLLRMGSFSGDQGKVVKLKVAIRGEFAQEARLEVAEVDPPQLKATVGEPQQMGEKLLHVPLIVEVPAGTSPIVRLGEPVSSDAHIVLRSNHEEIPDIRLRVRFAVE
ncbi:MAG: DUF1573 domain-containing protein [Planctomycetes bacterium]|nr:DUF1573 domain-containing protein [Planctomycetota bacterium]